MLIDWGQAPAWIGSLGTTISLGIAASVFTVNMRDRQRSQAAFVSVEPVDQRTAKVRNRSDAPIHMVIVWWDNAVGIPYSLGDQSVDTLAPGDDLTVAASSLPVPNEGCSPSVKFIDANGRRWHLTRWGKLRRLKAPKYPDAGYRLGASTPLWRRLAWYVHDHARPRYDIHHHLWNVTKESRRTRMSPLLRHTRPPKP